MGADLFESYVGAVVSALTLGVSVTGLFTGAGIIYPLVLAGCGIIASVIATFFVRSGEKSNPQRALSMVGSRISLLVGIIASAIILLIGSIYGSVSGYFGGRTDLIMMRIVDIIYTVPDILLIILLSMYLGKLVELAESYELTFHSVHPYTRSLISAIPVADPQLNRATKRIVLQGDVPSPVNPPSGCHFRTRCPYADSLCAECEPEWKEVSPGHFAACHHLDKVK